MVNLVAVSKDYKKGKLTVPVLRNLDLTIYQGEFLALMGASGSGKSTLLNLIGSIDRPSAGSIVVDGQNITKKSQSELAYWRNHTVSFIFQFYNLIPVLSAWDNIALPLRLQKLSSSQIKRRVDNALALVDLAQRANHKPNELSGGQQQRVAIARAIVTDPQLLLCDEPTGDLDRENANKVMAILSMLNKEYGKTIVMATHDASCAEIAHRTITFNKPDFN
uniref:ABC transporter ATP-binding protein n=2 Tax=Pseudoalteromonas rubra TaxID=43658 RepID=A0A0F4QW42_9GAMM|nr:ABC transporter ATP-binding protein [Pseudoalteromonas rubra]